MEYQCAEQVRAIRNLVNLNRQEFAELTGIPLNRLENIEKKNSRMFAEDVICIAEHFEPFMPWFLLNKDINLDEMKAAGTPILNIAISMFELGKYPALFEGKFRSFSKD